MGKPVIITLTVTDAKTLYDADPQPSTQLELDAYCTLKDDNNGKIPPDQTTINNFLSQVYSDNTVTWKGDNGNNSTSGYRVLINSITNNPNFFKVEPTGSSGQMIATLKTGIGGVEDTYTIGFSIDPPGNATAKTYGLDPKLGGNN